MKTQATMPDRLRIGLILNPVAGIGGPAALKGSDGVETVQRAQALGFETQVEVRTRLALDQLRPHAARFRLFTYGGPMGESVLADYGFDFEVVGNPEGKTTNPEDTRAAVRCLQQYDLDMLLFAGGDGTARDIFDALRPGQVVLGVPCGVKMHSGVFAINPVAAGKLVARICCGQLASVAEREVRDIDEEAFRQGKVRTRYYGEMCVPDALSYVQQTKTGGREVEAIVVADIAAEVVENMSAGVFYLVGSGSTTAAIMDALHLPNTLLGVDVVRDRALVLADANEVQLYDIVVKDRAQIIVTVIGGQGHIFGRGNQQLSPRVIRQVGLDHLTIVATKSKLNDLGDSGLLVDTGDAKLDQELTGLYKVTTGYEDAVLCRVSAGDFTT